MRFLIKTCSNVGKLFPEQPLAATYSTDAVFTDPALSVEDLLDERFAVIGCRGGDDPSMWWDLNIGVAFCT